MYQSIEIAQPIIHCSDEETEAQREAGISQGHTASDRQSRSAWFSSCPSLSATEHSQEPVPGNQDCSLQWAAQPVRSTVQAAGEGTREALGLYLSAVMGDCVGFNFEGLGRIRWDLRGGRAWGGETPHQACHQLRQITLPPGALGLHIS